MLWHVLPIKKIEEEFRTNIYIGLSDDEVAERISKHGTNRLPDGKEEGWVRIFLRQFASPLIYVLIIASVVLYALGEVSDSMVIAAVLFINAAIGAYQEGRAKNTLKALKKYAATNYATVLRNGHETVLSDEEIVPGDIVILREGEKVPADGRISESTALRIDESALTGESFSVAKNDAPMKHDASTFMERANMAYKGTYVVSGTGKLIVTETGSQTEIGLISSRVAEIKTEIPLHKDIRSLSKIILFVVALSGAALFCVGVISGKSPADMLFVVVSLSVSIIPEGLPVVLTLVLARGVWQMAKRNALVKKLQAVEALGQIGVIAVDKTGTLTRNEMVIRETWTFGNSYAVGGSGYEPKGEITARDLAIEKLNHPDLILAGKIATLGSSATVSYSESSKLWQISGDPTEAALGVFGEKVGFKHSELDHESPLLLDVPFGYQSKHHLRSHRVGDRQFITLIGAPESVYENVNSFWNNGKEPLTREIKSRFENELRSLSRKGLRVLAFAFKEEDLPVKGKPLGEIASGNFTLVGLFGMEDSLRAEVPEAVEKAISAGIRVIMITGDHKITAEAIAREAGIWRDGQKVWSGEEIDALDEAMLSRVVGSASVFARVTPEHKLRIIRAFRTRGEKIAMTGDGINDAPSLVAADLGVAMGRIGTEVAKNAGDIVLLDDNFGTIVAAVEEGRNIFKTIQNVLLYLFSTSLGEFFAIAGAIILGLGIPVTPAQILWLNLVTDGFLVVALAMGPKGEGLLARDYVKPPKYFIDRGMAIRVFLMAFSMVAGTLFLFSRYDHLRVEYGWTIALSALAVFQWFNAWNCKNGNESLFKKSLFSNRPLIFATMAVIILQLSIVYIPAFQTVMRTAPLNIKDWLVILACSLVIIVVDETRKIFISKPRLA